MDFNRLDPSEATALLNDPSWTKVSRPAEHCRSLYSVLIELVLSTTYPLERCIAEYQVICGYAAVSEHVSPLHHCTVARDAGGVLP